MSPASSEGSEARLLEAARSGDASALSTLLERHEPQLYRFARRLCRHREDAEDVLQDSLLAAARNLRTFRGDSALATWLYTIARSFCIKKRRRSVFAPVEVSLEGEGVLAVRGLRDPARGPEQALQHARLTEALEAGIASLDRRYREVLLLRDVEGLSANEVAGVTGLSLAAVKTRLHRARARLRIALAPFLGVGEPAEAAGSAASRCPDIVRLFSRHLEGDVSARTCARMERHLAGCPGCKAACEALKQVLQACRTAPGPTLPRELQERVRAAVLEAIGSTG